MAGADLLDDIDLAVLDVADETGRSASELINRTGLRATAAHVGRLFHLGFLERGEERRTWRITPAGVTAREAAHEMRAR